MAIDVDSSNCFAYIERSKVKSILEDYNGAKNDKKMAQVLFSNLDEGLSSNEKAGEEYDKENYEEAIKHYNNAISLLPNIQSNYFYRGCSKLYLDDYQGALVDFNHTIELNGDFKAEALNNRSEIKSIHLNDKSGALEDIEEAIALKPDDDSFYYNRSLLQDNYERIKSLNSAIAIDPNNSEYYLSRFLANFKMQDYKASVLDITKYIELDDPTDISISESYTFRAGIKIHLNDLSGSLKDHNIAVSTDSENEKAYFERAMLKAILSEKEDAILDLDIAIKINNKYGEAYYERGLLKQSIGMELDGRKDIEMAKSLGFQ
jgi:tetratricopeptide (TPR) repeat protein